MRDFKFRVWDKEKNKYCYADFDDLLSGVDCIPANDTALDFVVAIRECEPEQFTGLLDKNGREIYEGDYVKDFANVAGKIVYGKFDDNRIDEYSCPQFGFHISYPHGGQESIGPDSIEVIGNIHENPELLKVTENVTG